MEETNFSSIPDAEITVIRFGLATREEVCTASVSGCPISHATQLSNPFLGLPVEHGRCESCGTSDVGKCEGHFGYIELPIPIYHPSHVSDLKQMLSLLCLNCLQMKNNKFRIKSNGVAERLLNSCCEDAPQVSIREQKTKDGACSLELKIPSKSVRVGIWNFLERYGFRYYGKGDGTRTLLPCEAMEIFKRIPEATRRKFVGKGFFPQDGYILQYLPVPPNCLSIPDISDGLNVMSLDPSITMLKKLMKQIEIIKNSRSGTPNFESHEVEANELQSAVYQYLQIRGTTRSSRELVQPGVNKESSESTKAWLEKMSSLFIRKSSGFSSRSVITGDSYKKVNEVGIPYEVAQRVTFEEKVSVHNMNYLQDLVDKRLCLTYKDGSSTYSLREGSKGHTFLRPGQVVHRRIMDGDVVFINRPPTTHKHSLQALTVYVHEGHTVKINPLMCGPLSADFDGDCVHLFYPQSLAAKAEVLELFAVEKQLFSSHSGNLNLQMASDSLLSIKVLLRKSLMGKAAAQQLAMFASLCLPGPAVTKVYSAGPFWTPLQILHTVFPVGLDSSGDRHSVKGSEVIRLDFDRDTVPSVLNDIATSIFLDKGSEEVLKFFSHFQPLLMEHIFSEGFSLSLKDFSISSDCLRIIQRDIQIISPLLYRLKSKYNVLMEMQLENHIRAAKAPLINFILKSSVLGDLIDSKSDSAINKVVQQIGFLGVQISDMGKLYSKSLFEDVSSMYERKYPSEGVEFPCLKYGMIEGCFFRGLDPYEGMVHSISSREVMVRSSRGLIEPGTLFKNLMAILRDVVICYDGTVRNVCSHSIVQFLYGTKAGTKPQDLYPAGEPVGTLAATAMSNPAYKAVLDSTPSSNSSWELMKEILTCKVSFKNEPIDRRVILYLNDCTCGRKFCLEHAAYKVKNRLSKVSLKDTAIDFLIEYRSQQSMSQRLELDAGLAGHIHLNEVLLNEHNVKMHDILQKCKDSLKSLQKKHRKGGVGKILRATVLSTRECCLFEKSPPDKRLGMPCLMIVCEDTSDLELEDSRHILADVVCPVLLETIIKGDPRICSANIIWINPDTTTWVRSLEKSQKGEVALDVVVEKSVVKRSGDAWRILLDSCLPVLHLIDTWRSIPYGIKQVQELLGISCSFDLAVQRLATSVSMVAKGVLKEHLILLASSMTCAGNMVGFNSAGYKKLSYLLSLQMPFTEATRFTPKRCFERAAEKCHVDSLSSIVASCSWGKHVAVGTGSRFDLLLDSGKVGVSQEVGDVYSFLYMMNDAKGEEPISACLGAEIDDLMDNETEEIYSSPKPDSNFDAPTFEDIMEWENGDEALPGGWDNKKNQKASSGNNQWENTGSSPWGRKAEDAGPDGSADQALPGEWDKKVSSNKVTTWNTQQEDEGTSGWGRKAEDTSKYTPGRSADQALPGEWDKKVTSNKVTSWNNEQEDASTSAWGRKAEDASKFTPGRNADQALPGEWDKKVTSNKVISWNNEQEDASTSAWGRKAEDASKFTPGRNADQALPKEWDKKVTSNKVTSWNNEQEDASTSAWGRKAEDASKFTPGRNADQALPGEWDKKANSYKVTTWDNPQEDAGTCAWGRKDEAASNKYTSERSADQVLPGEWDRNRKVTPKKSASWGNRWEETETSGWGRKVKNAGNTTPEKSADHDLPVEWDKKTTASGSTNNQWEETDIFAWGRKAKDASKSDTDGSKDQPMQSDWENKTSEKELSRNKQWDDSGGHAWARKAEESNDLVPNRSNHPSLPSDWDKVTPEKPATWNNQQENASGFDWARKIEDFTKSTPDKIDTEPLHPNWENKVTSKEATSWNDNGSQRQWGRQRGEPFKKDSFEGARGGGSSAGIYTSTRQRMDIFTSDEQDALSTIEAIMLKIRKIMQSGYKDEEPLSDDDRSFVIDNVLNYHPEKAAKMGCGIDHIMVSKHTSFTESRCFYVVSSDGRKEDFSYRKSLENFIKGKYPDVAEAFLAKYFRKPRPGGNRKPNHDREQTWKESVGTPSSWRESEAKSNPFREQTWKESEGTPNSWRESEAKLNPDKEQTWKESPSNWRESDVKSNLDQEQPLKESEGMPSSWRESEAKSNPDQEQPWKESEGTPSSWGESETKSNPDQEHPWKESKGTPSSWRESDVKSNLDQEQPLKESEGMPSSWRESEAKSNPDQEQPWKESEGTPSSWGESETKSNPDQEHPWKESKGTPSSWRESDTK